MANTPNLMSDFVGRWRIVSSSAWEDDYLDEEAQTFVEFEDKDGGSSKFGCVQQLLNCRITNREGKPAVEFSWEGGDDAEGTPLTGRGWAILLCDQLHGMIYFHEGDGSEFVATRATKIGTERK